MISCQLCGRHIQVKSLKEAKKQANRLGATLFWFNGKKFVNLAGEWVAFYKGVNYVV